MKNRLREFDETPLWRIACAVFPWVIYKAGYDSFHEPKWLALTAFVGAMALLRSLTGKAVFRPRTTLELPLLFCLLATLLAWRWEAGDRAVAFVFWSRLAIGYLLFRLWTSWLAGFDRDGRARRIGGCLNAFVLGGVGVAALAILQDWGISRWSDSPVSDWRFHLSSTVGNPNEVGGYISYLAPVVWIRWFLPSRSTPSRGERLLWAGVGLVLLYGLTTVFTVGAWLGLFCVTPLMLGVFPHNSAGHAKRILFGYLGAGLVFLVLQGVLRYPGPAEHRIWVFLVLGAVALAGVGFIARKVFGDRSYRCVGALSALLVVWFTLLLPWGIPNHPDGLVEEAVSSPRWRGGFGARRFIWQTTGLMVKDHPLRGIGWGHYYTMHALYQGEVYRQRDLPHDRPTVGLVPQAHSDPLQILAEGGTLASLGFFWLAASVLFLAARRIKENIDPCKAMSAELWACCAGLGLVGFHCAVDFPLRQPQPVFLALFFIAAIACGARTKKTEASLSFGMRTILLVFGVALMFSASIGFRDQALLKKSFQGLLYSSRAPNPEAKLRVLQNSAAALDSLTFPMPETHDRWVYRARIATALGDAEGARSALTQAARYRHGSGLYEAWRELGSLSRNPELSLGALRGLIRYNPCWASFHKEAAKLERILGNEKAAREDEALAEKYRVEEK